MTKIEKVILAALISSASVMASFISPELVLIKNFFSLKNNQLSQIMTLYLAGYLLGQILWAHVSNKIGRVTSIKCGMAISIFGAIFIMAAMKIKLFGLFLTGRVLVALGLASGLVCGFTIIKERLQDFESKRYLSIIAFTFTASIYLSILVSGYLAKYSSLKTVIWTVLAYNIVMFGLSLCLKAVQGRHEVVKKQHYSINSKPYSKVIIFSLVLSITTIISYSYALYAPIITSEVFQLSPVDFGILSLSNMIFIFLGGVLYLKLTKVLSEQTLMTFGLLTIIAVTLLFLLIAKLDVQPNIFGFFILCSFLNIVSGLIYPAATYEALKYGSCKATSSAIMNIIKLVMPMLALYTSSHFYMKELNAFMLTIVIFALSYFFILILTNIRRVTLCSNELVQ